MTKASKSGKMYLDPMQIAKKYGIVIVLILMILGLSIAEPAFLSSVNIFNVLTQSSIFGIMALGMTFVIISKGIDLSVGSILAFAGVVAASLGQLSSATGKYFPNLAEMPVIVPIAAALGIGALMGAVSGLLIARTRIPAFIATLGMMTVARGLALIYSSGKPVSTLIPSLTALGGKVFNVLPVPVIIYFLMIIISSILLNKTRFGKNIYAIGGNITAAEVSGVNVSKNLVWIYTYCGLLAGLAAIVFAGRVGSVHPGAASGYELTAIAATTIGGTSHSGGIGTVWGAFVGALVLAVMRNGLTLLGVDAYWQQVVEGLIIVVAVIIDMRKNAKRD
ncbi:MAG: sugar ABC transporter permease [Treponema sp. GWB1_62_6]|nr:MAG: sugar ABC transporter permease [Treponema sp. GWC1_61_84]OHE70991.1 MAG: sugar ABC transporter permease [Treponema sp. GWB1_62_6]OHE74489.1 MAG: sugar ABC transporter permease [Treponema sp. RIFOXYC1_FULL_61_9]